ncbi:uncharacterized metal-dependent hydrolase YcfH-like [Diadema setosum]|uniref:uncharacterized metal-dependent hydrolase YcfH-like n=1 Tax=Diadema setosum TaxID=31175 RepID=UPI003B3A24C7
MERLLKLKGLGPALARRVGRPPKVPVSVVGGVLNYCDPEHYPGIVFPADARWKVVVGIHPKHAGRTCDRHIFELEQLLKDDRVVGVSELGLDYSVPDSLWTAQLGLMERILRIGTIGKVHVLHIRGSRGDPLGEAAHEQCRKIMQKHCPPEIRIHLHCCNGYATQVQSPAGAAGSPLQRLLLETDAPHLKPPLAIRCNSPRYLGEVARVVAEIRGESVERICNAATENAHQLYRM